MKIKFLYLVAAFLLLSLAIIISCRKTDISKNTIEQFDLAAAKEWWYSSFRKSAEYNRVDYTSIFAPPAGNTAAAQKHPSWKRGKSFRVGKMEVVEMPLVYNFRNIIFPGASRYTEIEKKKAAAASLQKLLLVKVADGSIKARTVTLIPTPQYARDNNYDISKNTATKLDKLFCGWLVVKGWNETVINFWEIEKGKIVKKLKAVSVSASARTSVLVCYDEPTVENTSSLCVGYTCGDEPCSPEGANGECDNWIININLGSQLACEYQPDEVEDPWNDCILGASTENCLCQALGICGTGDLCALYGIDCGGEEPPLVTTDVVNQLTSPCFIQFVNAIGNTKLKNFIAHLYQQTYVGNGNVLNILFEEQPNLTDPYTGHPVPALSNHSTISASTYVILLNTSLNGFGTHEFWGQTIMHEIIHSFMRENGFDFSGGSGFTQEHQNMLTSWVLDLQEALIEIYGTNENDALALSLQGIDDVLLEEATGQYLETMRNYVSEFYNMDLDQAWSLAEGYGDKTKGTACQ